MKCDEWYRIPLSEICDIIMGQSPNGEDCNTSGIGLPLLNGPTEFGTFYPTPVQWTTDKKKECECADLLFCVRGSTTGRMNWADQSYAIGRGLAAIRHKHGVEYRHFVKGLIDYILPSILNATTGSTFPNVSKDLLSNIAISVPPLPEQHAIAATLSCLDDKIELNNRMNKTLEEMAQAIFKSWFVNFEPFQDGEFVDSELGRIPKGWRLGTLPDLGTVVGGSTPSKANQDFYTQESIAWITPKDLSIQKTKFIVHGEIDITENGLKNSSAKLMPKGTVLFSSRAPIGYLAIAAGEVCTNQGFKSVVPHANIGSPYVYFFLKSNLSMIEGRATGSTFKEVSSAIMKSVPALIPPDDILQRFTTICTPSFSQQLELERENSKISQIRDTLLPKLMSGEIRVPTNS